MRVRIAATVGQSCREVERKVLEGWLRLFGEEFERFVDDICGWGIDGGNVLVPPNKENEAKGTVVRENVQFDRESIFLHRRFLSFSFAFEPLHFLKKISMKIVTALLTQQLIISRIRSYNKTSIRRTSVKRLLLLMIRYPTPGEQDNRVITDYLPTLT